MKKNNKHRPIEKPAGLSGESGARLRAMRNARDLTLEQLSRMAGVSKAMLSQIEQGKVNPTVAVMLRIAGALQSEIGDLVGAGARQAIFRIIRATDGQYTFRADSDCAIRTLSPLDLEKNIEFYRVTLGAGAELASEAHFPGTEEFVHVTKGRLTVECGDQSADVGKGDSIHYRADVPHVLRNAGKGRTEMYMIVRYRT